jgi:CRISPR-associated protein Cas2
MIIISYDIKNNKLRGKFAKFIIRFGCRIQYSVYRIDNSGRILDNITSEICNRF